MRTGAGAAAPGDVGARGVRPEWVACQRSVEREADGGRVDGTVVRDVGELEALDHAPPVRVEGLRDAFVAHTGEDRRVKLNADSLYLLGGLALLAGAVLPRLLRHKAVSTPMAFLAVGMLL